MMTKQQMEDQEYDYKKSIEELKNMMMYLDEKKNMSEIISIQVDAVKQFGNILEQRRALEKSFDEYNNLTEEITDWTEGLFPIDDTHYGGEWIFTFFIQKEKCPYDLELVKQVLDDTLCNTLDKNIVDTNSHIDWDKVGSSEFDSELTDNDLTITITYLFY